MSCFSSSESASKIKRKTLINRFPYLFNDKEKSICIVGFDFAGKTSLVYEHIACGSPDRENYVIGFVTTETVLKSTQFLEFDISRNSNYKMIHKYLKDKAGSVAAVILVVDSSDPEGFEDVKNYFEKFNQILENKCPILVYLNKMDKTEAVSVEEFEAVLMLENTAERPVHYQPSSFLKGEGIDEGLAWLEMQSKLL